MPGGPSARPTCKDPSLLYWAAVSFCQGFCNTPRGEVLTSRCQHLSPPRQLQAASDRQTITLALRPGSHGLCGKESWSRVFPPHEDSLRVFYFSVKTGDWNEVTRGHDLNHTTVMRCFWCGVNSTTRRKPTFQRGKVPGARGTCWTTPLTFPISKDESAGPLLTAAQKSLISFSASKWPTPWLKHDSDFNHCFCSSPEKTLHSN